VIQVRVGRLVHYEGGALVRPMRSDLAPTTAASREVWAQCGDAVRDRLELVGEVPVGGAVITPAGELPCDFLIHAVTSTPTEAEAPLTVQRALRNALRRAADWGVESLAVPPMGGGVGVMGLEGAATTQVEILRNHLDEGPEPRDLTILVANEYEEDVYGRMVASRVEE